MLNLYDYLVGTIMGFAEATWARIIALVTLILYPFIIFPILAATFIFGLLRSAGEFWGLLREQVFPDVRSLYISGFRTIRSGVFSD